MHSARLTLAAAIAAIAIVACSDAQSTAPAARDAGRILALTSDTGGDTTPPDTLTPPDTTTPPDSGKVKNPKKPKPPKCDTLADTLCR